MITIIRFVLNAVLAIIITLKVIEHIESGNKELVYAYLMAFMLCLEVLITC